MVTECGRKRTKGCNVVYPLPSRKVTEKIKDKASRVITKFAKKALAKVKAMKAAKSIRSKLFYDPSSLDLSKAKFYDKRIGINVRKKGQMKSLPSVNKFIQQKVRASQQTEDPEIRKKARAELVALSKKKSRYEDIVEEPLIQPAAATMLLPHLQSSPVNVIVPRSKNPKA